MAGPSAAGSLVRSARDARVALAALSWLFAWVLLVVAFLDLGRGRPPGTCSNWIPVPMDPLWTLAQSITPPAALMLGLVVPAATLLPLALGVRRRVASAYCCASLAALGLAATIGHHEADLWAGAFESARPLAHGAFALLAVPTGLFAIGAWVALCVRLLRVRRGCLPAEVVRAFAMAGVPAALLAAATIRAGVELRFAPLGLLVPPAWAACGTLLPLAIGCALAVRLHRPRSMGT